MVAEHDRDRHAQRLKDRHELRNGRARARLGGNLGTEDIVARQHDQIGLRGADCLPQEYLDPAVQRFDILNVRKVEDAESAVGTEMQMRVFRGRSGERGKDSRKRERACQQDTQCFA